MPDKKNKNRLVSNGEKDPKSAPAFAIKKLAQFIGKYFILKSERTASWLFLKGRNRVHQAAKPAIGEVWIAVSVKGIRLPNLLLSNGSNLKLNN